jgi:hypothetical protein
LKEESSRGRDVVRRWSLSGTPKGLVVGAGGTIYVGLSGPQSVVAVDPLANTILKETVLDRKEIASTKDFSTLRIGNEGRRLYVAQGSDESVSVLSLPELEITREILIEGERIRDALPDPAGQYLYVLGRRVHVYDIEGQRSIRRLSALDPLALATDESGSVLAVVGFEQFPNGRATMIAFYDTRSFDEIGRMPLQTDREIISAFFAAGDEVIVTLATDWLAEAPARPRQELIPTATSAGDTMRLHIDFGDLVSSETVCPPDGAGPQIATTDTAGSTVVFAEKRCSAGSTFTASARRTRSASIYGIDAYAIARTPEGFFAASDPAGYLTIYRAAGDGRGK